MRQPAYENARNVKNPPGNASEDSLVAYIAAIVILALAIVVGIGWYYFQSRETIKTDVAYTKFGPVRVQTQGASFRANIAVQTRTGLSSWTLEEKRILDSVFQKVLSEADPKNVLTQSGMEPLQNALRNAGNAALNTTILQAVFVTDFLIVANEDE